MSGQRETIEAKTLPITGLATSLVAAGGLNRGLALRIESGPKDGRTISVGTRVVKLGAGRDNEVVLEDKAVSRHHAEARATRGGVLVQDLSSTNGTYVAGAKIQEAVIAIGGEFVVGETHLRVIDAGGPQVAPSTRDRFGSVIGTSRVMREVFAVLELAAATDVTVMLEGPSGTGKEHTARAVHDHSPRASGPFVIFDCGSVSKDLLQSALMGHKKGAFTGATSDRAGAFVEADKGTLFLDEIGELPLESQTHLLRALESGEVIPVGGDRIRKVNTRVVAATNRDLFEMVEAGTFRLDLFHRLAVVHVRIPSLKDHLEDLAPIIRGFYQGRSLDPGPISGENLERLRAHSFEGNVRELRNILERSWVLSGNQSTKFTDLNLWMGPNLGEAGGASQGFDIDVDLPFKEAKESIVEAFEAQYLPLLLETFSNNISHAAKHAGLSRRHLRALLVKHGLKTQGDEENA